MITLRRSYQIKPRAVHHARVLKPRQKLFYFLVERACTVFKIFFRTWGVGRTQRCGGIQQRGPYPVSKDPCTDFVMIIK